MPDKKKMGRPCLLNDETERRIIINLASGVPIGTAAVAAGVTSRTVDNWIARGKAALQLEEEGIDTGDEAKFANFFRRCKEAEETQVIQSLARIRRAGQNGSWQADAWFLERRHGYTRRERIDHAAVTSDTVDATDESLSVIAARVLQEMMRADTNPAN
jgi:hypothetical protein